MIVSYEVFDPCGALHWYGHFFPLRHSSNGSLSLILTEAITFLLSPSLLSLSGRMHLPLSYRINVVQPSIFKFHWNHCQSPLCSDRAPAVTAFARRACFRLFWQTFGTGIVSLAVHSQNAHFFPSKPQLALGRKKNTRKNKKTKQNKPQQSFQFPVHSFWFGLPP